MNTKSVKESWRVNLAMHLTQIDGTPPEMVTYEDLSKVFNREEAYTFLIREGVDRYDVKKILDVVYD